MADLRRSPRSISAPTAVPMFARPERPASSGELKASHGEPEGLVSWFPSVPLGLAVNPRGACRPESFSRLVAVREVAVGQPPVVLVVSQLPGLVGSDRLRDPFVELREGLRS